MATLLIRNLLAVHHQHFFNFRLDMDVDGTRNSVAEMNTEAESANPGNPYKNAFVMKATACARNQRPTGTSTWQSSRKWEVVNPSVKNNVGESTGYILVPEENSVPYAAPDSWLRKRAGFIDAHFWATAYDPIKCTQPVSTRTKAAEMTVCLSGPGANRSLKIATW